MLQPSPPRNCFDVPGRCSDIYPPPYRDCIRLDFEAFCEGTTLARVTAGSRPVSVQFVGLRSVARPTGSCLDRLGLAINASSLDFGTVVVGNSGYLSETITNRGTASVTILQATVTNPEFTIVQPSFPRSIRAGGAPESFFASPRNPQDRLRESSLSAAPTSPLPCHSRHRGSSRQIRRCSLQR